MTENSCKFVLHNDDILCFFRTLYLEEFESFLLIMQRDQMFICIEFLTAAILFRYLIISLWKLLSKTVTSDVYTQAIRPYQQKALQIMHASNPLILLLNYANLDESNNLFKMVSTKLSDYFENDDAINLMKK